jgi:hypothetical protein
LPAHDDNDNDDDNDDDDGRRGHGATVSERANVRERGVE